MKRLTREHKPYWESDKQEYESVNCHNWNDETDEIADLQKCVEKLGQLEDIEEKLGIDLITLFKALKDRPYLKDKMENGTTFISQGAVHLEKAFFENNLILCCGVKEPSYYRLKDYGKTWALTKEELEK